jgi:hypothetical protein
MHELNTCSGGRVACNLLVAGGCLLANLFGVPAAIPSIQAPSGLMRVYTTMMHCRSPIVSRLRCKRGSLLARRSSAEGG